jgi:hypothetical protein
MILTASQRISRPCAPDVPRAPVDESPTCPRRWLSCSARALATSTHVRDQDLDLVTDRWSAVVVFLHPSGSDGTEAEQSEQARSFVGLSVLVAESVLNEIRYVAG